MLAELRRLLQDLHPPRLPGQPVRAADQPAAVPVPPVAVRRPRQDAKPIFGPATRPLPKLPITVDDEGYFVRDVRLQEPSDPASGSGHEADARRCEPAASCPATARGRGARRPARAGRPRCDRLLNKVFPDHWSFMLGEIALYSFIILLLTGTFLTFFFDPSMEEVLYDGSYTPLQRHRDVPGLRLDAEHLLRRPRRPDHAADPPLGGAAVHGRDRRAHAPGVLHRRVPQAARAQLDHRRRPVLAGLRRGLRRLLDARRPARPAPGCGSPTRSSCRSR